MGRRLAGITACGLAKVLATTVLGAGIPARAQDAPRPSEEEIVERVLELKREIDELLSHLPAETRKKLLDKLAEPPPAPPAEAELAAPGQDPPEPRSRRVRPACNTLDVFDTNRDGVVEALDRYFRYLYLWIDRNRDGKIEEREIESTYKEKVTEISTALEFFESDRAGRGEVLVRDRIWLDLRGNGFGSDDDAVLVVDATALKRGTGPTLLDGSGREVEGVRPFEQGWTLRDAGGRVTRLSCP